MKEEDIERIIKYRISPINVSVHTTNPELRIKMLNNRFAGNIYDILKRLAEADIKVNTQVVCCPGINDGEELIRTIEDLYVLYPSVENLAVVPLGITKFRANLPHLKLFTKEKSKELIESVKILQDKYVKENGTPFVRLSDEFYVMAGSEPPTEEHYGGYEQLEDGIGMIRILKNTIKEQVEYLNKKAKGNFTIITGASAKTVLEEVANSIMKVNSNIKINVIAVENKFFGTTITVAGLLTGIDIINTAKEETLGDYIIIPNNMLKKGYELGEEVEGLLLDDYTVRDLEKILNKKFLVCDYAGDDLINILNKHLEEE